MKAISAIVVLGGLLVPLCVPTHRPTRGRSVASSCLYARGPADVLARSMAMRAKWGQTVIVDNKPAPTK